MILSTTPTIEGKPVKSHHGIVAGETIVGANVVRDFFASITDVIGGQISMMMDIISTASAFIQSGKVRAIGVTSPQRNPALPEVPAIAESGIEGLKGFDVGGWYG